jgi:hypothetical protein
MKFIVFALLFFGVSVFADTLQRFKNVNYDDNYMDVEGFVLGRTCYSLKASRLSLDCNPAMMAGETKRNLNLQVNLDDNVKEVYGYGSELQDKNSDGLLRRILNNPKPLTANEVAAAWWQYDWWAVSVVPARLNVATVVRNPAYPVVTSHVSLQREVSARGGLFVSEDPRLRVGANVRFVENRQLRKEFELFDVAAGTEDIAVKQSESIFVEPAMAYAFDTGWESQLSFVLTHLAVYESSNEIPDAARPEIGYSTTPNFLDHKLRTSIHYTARPDVASTMDKFRFGGIFEFSDQLASSFTIGGSELGLGLLGRIDSLDLGIGAKTEKFILHGEEIDNVNTVLFQAGLNF